MVITAPEQLRRGEWCQPKVAAGQGKGHAEGGEIRSLVLKEWDLSHPKGLFAGNKKCFLLVRRRNSKCQGEKLVGTARWCR